MPGSTAAGIVRFGLLVQPGVSYADLRRAVDAAIETSAIVTDLSAMTEQFAKIYASGRRFIAAIDRVARDPVAPVRAALKDAFKTTLDELIGTAAGLIDATAVSALATIETDVENQVRILLADPTLVAYRRLVFALRAHAQAVVQLRSRRTARRGFGRPAYLA